ncbi:hypothetical protein RFI02_20105, partial [Acinetobacter sichuanensis]|nr:hypothetical protein [Acinetobacter sichuanensis]
STHKNHLDGHIELRRKALVKEANAEAEKKYQENLTDLINRASQAQSPAEANALVRYTKPWTEEQRKPLVDAIHKRLAELDPPAKSESSLMVRINNAQSLEELEILETEIKQSDERVQARLFNYANQRRADLVSYEETQNWDDQ